MKRLLALLTALLIAALPLSAYAWEVSPKHEALAAQHFPGCGVLDGFTDGAITALLLTTPEDEKRLAFCTVDAAALTQPLPDHLFQIADAHLFADAAMLLLEDYEGTAYFVGCTPSPDGWMAQVSTPLPEGTVLLDRDYRPWEYAQLRWTVTLPAIGGTRQEQRTVTLRADGWLWRVSYLEGEYNHVDFRQDFVMDNVMCVHGTFEFATDVTEVDWLRLPITVEEAAARMDMSNRAILTEEAWLYGSPSEEKPIARCNPGMPLLILGYEGDWAHVLLAGAPVGGYMQVESMLIGSRQTEARYLMPDIGPLVNRYENELDVYLMPVDDLTLSPLLIHLDWAQARYVKELAVWPEEGWTMLYSEEIPGGVGFVHTEQLEAVRPLG